jgi:hypothetical protein
MSFTRSFCFGRLRMTFKLLLSAAAVIGALAVGSAAFAQDKDMHKPMHHHARHHHAMHHDAAMHHEHKAHHGMHGGMGIDAKERAATIKLNQEQLSHPGM